MNGGQDLGGMHGFGPLEPEAGEPPFHADWERRIFALTLAMGFTGQWNIDASRHARESLPPAQYLSSSYYEIWLAGLERLLRERGLVSEDEIVNGRSAEPARPLARSLAAADVDAALRRGGPAERNTDSVPRFAPGERVRTIPDGPQGHTRLPRYARGRPGEIARVHGHHVFPDCNAMGLGEAPRWLYSVCFAARDLWGAAARTGDRVYLDLWEPYLEHA
jgi:nitrile hydratase subunit beta